MNPVKAARTMIERDNSCLGKIRKDMDKIKIRSRALNTQTKYLTGAYYLKYQLFSRISMWKKDCAANSAFQQIVAWLSLPIFCGLSLVAHCLEGLLACCPFHSCATSGLEANLTTQTKTSQESRSGFYPSTLV